MSRRVSPPGVGSIGMWLRVSSALTAVVVACGLPAPEARALPAGGQVVGGQATIGGGGLQTTVTQATDRGIINWQSFDIAAGEQVRFQQPSASSVTLNRVTGGGGASQIMGQLSANGTVVLVNPNGVIFGPTSQVNVGSLVATTADIADDRFLAGDYRFDKAGNPNAGIANQGRITVADAGLAAFVAPNVVNDGIIQAKLGTIELASGDKFTLDLYGDGLISLEASEAIQSQLVSNSGILSAKGGRVALTAAAANDVVNSLINTDGIIEATSIGEQNGEIVIFAEGSNAVRGNDPAQKGKKQGSSTVLVSGVLDVSGRNTGERGGKLTVSGDNVALLAGTVINASGHSGLSGTTRGQAVSAYRDGSAGGDIRIGGDYLGQGNTPTAQNLYVDPGALILNDSLHTGDAGRTIFWSDGTTRFYGNVYARALGGLGVDQNTWGATSGGNVGDGGFVETSGYKHLDAGGYVNLTASSGDKGTYFLDPTDITIYGNVDPAFQSTDGTINLAANLKLWLDASDLSRVTLTYSTDGLSGATATGTAGSNTITTSTNVSASLAVGARIRLGSAGAVTTAATLGADTYTIAAISGTTITLSGNLTQNYTGSTLHRGLVSQLADKSGQGNNASQATATNMPLWVSNGQNGLGITRYDGVNDYLGGITRPNDAQSTLYAVGQNLGNGGTHRVLVSFAGAVVYASLPGGTWGTYHNADVSYGNTLSASPRIFGIVSRAANDVDLIDGGVVVNRTGGNAYNNRPLATGGAGQSGVQFSAVDLSESFYYSVELASNARHLVDQYQSAKWGIALTPPGTGATEVAKATASDGYSAFTTRYLERLSQSANISLQATNSITLDLKGDTLALANDRNLSLTTANGNISSVSAGTITTNRTTTGGNITMTATNGTLDTSNLSISAGGDVSLTSGGAMTLGTASGKTILARSMGPAADLTIASGKTLSASGSGSSLVLASGRNFVNNAGSGALSAPNGRWLVYSADPAQNTLGGLTAGFSQYNTTYAGNPPSSIGNAGQSGLLYSLNNFITLTADNLSRAYGSANPALTYGFFCSTGCSQGDATTGAPSLTTLAGATTGVGTSSITIGLGNLALTGAYSGYQVQLVGGTLTITQAPLTVAASDRSKTYGDVATFAGTEFTAAGLRNGETVGGVSLSSAGAGASATVAGGPYAIAVSNATGGTFNPANYSIAYNPGTLTVVPRSLVAGLQGAVSKTYDGTTAASLAAGHYLLTGVIGADAVSLNNPASGSYDSKNVGTGKAVSVNGLSLSGADSGNYQLASSSISGNIGTILARTLTASLVGSVSKVYDGDVFATLLPANYSMSGKVAGDSLLLNSPGIGTYDTKAVGSGKAVTVSGLGLVGGDAGNYQLASGTISGSVGSITARPLNITGVTAQDKVYDGDVYAVLRSGGASLSGVVPGDVVSLETGSASGTFADKHVGANKAVTASGYTMGGSDSGNYTLSQPVGLAASITQRLLSISGVAASNKVYDGTTTAALSGGSITTATGLVAGDSVTLLTGSASGSFADKNVGANKAVTASGYALSGVDSGNYALSQPAGLTASITARGLGVTATAADKGYDGTAAATVTLSDDRVAGDGLAVSYGSAVFDSADAGAGKAVTVSGLSVSGADAGNYQLVSGSASGSASVFPRALRVRAHDASVTAGAGMPAFGYSHAGLVAADSPAVFSGGLTSPGGRQSEPGTYPILQGSLGAGGNYTIEYTPGLLTVGLPVGPILTAQSASTRTVQASAATPPGGTAAPASADVKVTNPEPGRLLLCVTGSRAIYLVGGGDVPAGAACSAY